LSMLELASEVKLVSPDGAATNDRRCAIAAELRSHRR